MPYRTQWSDCFKFLPYKDHLGKWHFFPLYTQRRRVRKEGKRIYEYREREETVDEYYSRQW